MPKTSDFYTKGDDQNVKGRCMVCGKNMRNPNDPDIGPHGIWPEDWEVYHCGNGVALFCKMREVHHTRWPLWPNCWRCGRHMGCVRCTEEPEKELVKYSQWIDEKGNIRGNPYYKRVLKRLPDGSLQKLKPENTMVCGECRVYQTKADLIRSGLNPWIRLDNHPEEWQDAYYTQVESGEYDRIYEAAIRKIPVRNPNDLTRITEIRSLWQKFKANQKSRDIPF